MKKNNPTELQQLKVYIEITDPRVVGVLFHEKKQMLLKILIEQDYTINELSKKTNLNPGTIKRHLTDLESAGLIRQSKRIKNEYGINLKYYRAVAKEFRVNMKFP